MGFERAEKEYQEMVASKDAIIDGLKVELDWWKRHAEAMESKLTLSQRGFKVESTNMKDMPRV